MLSQPEEPSSSPKQTTVRAAKAYMIDAGEEPAAEKRKRLCVELTPDQQSVCDRATD